MTNHTTVSKKINFIHWMWNCFSSVPTKSYNNINMLSFPAVSLQKDDMKHWCWFQNALTNCWSTSMTWMQTQYYSFFFFFLTVNFIVHGGSDNKSVHPPMRNHIDVIPAPLTVTKSFSEAPHSVCMPSVPLLLPASTTLSLLLIPDWSKGVSLETASFIHVQTHNLLKHSHRIQSSRLCTSFRGIQLWHLISPPHQIAQPEITERIPHLWFAILPFCMYSCALHTANYGLTLIIMDFVCSQQPLTARTFLWTIGNWTN